jgi:hypothetical protein
MEIRILVGIQFYVLREKLLIVLRLEFFEFLSCLILCCSYNSFSYFIIFVFVFYSLSIRMCLSVSSIYIVWASFHFYWSCKSFFFLFFLYFCLCFLFFYVRIYLGVSSIYNVRTPLLFCWSCKFFFFFFFIFVFYYLSVRICQSVSSIYSIYIVWATLQNRKN